MTAELRHVQQNPILAGSAGEYRAYARFIPQIPVILTNPVPGFRESLKGFSPTSPWPVGLIGDFGMFCSSPVQRCRPPLSSTAAWPPWGWRQLQVMRCILIRSRRWTTRTPAPSAASVLSPPNSSPAGLNKERQSGRFTPSAAA